VPLQENGRDVDLIVLAQASMARVLPELPVELQGRLLTSPRTGMQAAAMVLNGTHA